MGGAPPGYDAAGFARDFAVFRRFVKATAPGMRILGPGSVGEGIALTGTAMPGLLKTSDLLAATPRPVFDVFSYHFYGAVSMRCASLGAGMNGTTPDAALSEDWLARTGTVQAFYAALRDQDAPGTPMWLTETADAACGGNPWAVTFVDSFRYLEQLGRLARRGVETVFHNTLAASEYGLIDQQMLTPRPNYWAAVLWHRLMGPTVLDAATSASDLHLYRPLPSRSSRRGDGAGDQYEPHDGWLDRPPGAGGPLHLERGETGRPPGPIERPAPGDARQRRIPCPRRKPHRGGSGHLRTCEHHVSGHASCGQRGLSVTEGSRVLSTTGR